MCAQSPRLLPEVGHEFGLLQSAAGEVEDYRVGLVAGRGLAPDLHFVICPVVGDHEGGFDLARRGAHGDDGTDCHSVASGGFG